MRDVLLAFGLGLLLSAQVGPVTLLIVRSVTRGRRALLVGPAMAAAVAGVDLPYAGVGLAGAGRVLADHGLRLALGLVSAAVLLGLGWRTLWRGIRARHGLEWPDETEPAHAFLTAIAATALNLLTIALWTISATLAWYCGFAAAIGLLRRRVRPGLVGYRTLHGER